jgi:hypothetical protein
MNLKALAGVFAGAMALSSASAAYASIEHCEDHSSRPYVYSVFNNTNVSNSIRFDMVAGDQLAIRLLPESVVSDGTAALHLGSDYSDLESVTSLDNEVDFAPFTASVDIPYTTLSISVVFTANVSGTLEVTCSHPVAPPTPNTSDIQFMQDGIVKHATLNATEMMTDLVDGGVDAAFDAQAAQKGTQLGYTAGTVVLDNTPDALKGTGISLWSGLKYGVTPGATDQWTGMQVSGAAGLNYNLSDALVIGAFGGYEASGFGMKSTDQNFTAHGGSFGALAAYRLDDNWRIQTDGYVSLLGYDLDAAGVKAKFGAIRYVLNGSLVGTMPLTANIDFVPMAGLSVVREDQSAYTDSASVDHGKASILAGRGSVGGKFVFYPTDGLVTFSAGGYADYWAGDAFGDGGLSGRVEVGTDIGVGDSGTIGLKGSVGNLGNSGPLTVSANASIGGAL